MDNTGYYQCDVCHTKSEVYLRHCTCGCEKTYVYQAYGKLSDFLVSLIENTSIEVLQDIPCGLVIKDSEDTRKMIRKIKQILVG